MKPRYVLFDTDIVIEAYEMGIWQMLIERIDIYVPCTVVKNEALFYRKEMDGIPEEIKLSSLIDKGSITELSADVEDLAKLGEVFNSLFLENLHSGEREALAFLYAEKVKDIYFCTADAAPIQAIAMLRMSEQGISFENLLKGVGIQKNLRRHFTENWFKQNLVKGKQKFIKGEGLKENYRGKIF